VSKEKSHVFRNDLNKKPPVIAKGNGIYLYDKEGNRYLDGAGGSIVVNLGHGIKEIAQVMKDQAEQIAFSYRSQFSNSRAEELAKKLYEITRRKMEKVFFVSGGSEATEIGVKLARKYHMDNEEPSRFKVISRWQSYHGGTMGALSWSGHVYRRKDYIHYLRDFNHIPPAYCYRCWFNQKPESCDLECAKALENEILCEGPETVAVFIAEPIVGASLAAAVPREGYFQRIREICDRYGVLLILDEVMTGFGRTGSLFGYEHFNVIPDIMTAGKGMSSGYYPMGAVMATSKICETIAEKSGIFVGGYTYGGNPLGCAVANKSIDYLLKHNLVERSAKMGKYLFSAAENLREHPTVGDIRGKGLMMGIEFVKNRRTRETIDKRLKYANQIFNEALKQGLTILPGDGCNRGQSGDMILVGPPFIITEKQIDELVNILDRVISVVEKKNKFESSRGM
jgi:adenosylmethionine-8-amino-7-oxononanoate aminotransferase